MKPIVRSTILLFAMVFLGGAVFAWFDVLTHDNILTNPELKFATGWLMTGLMFSDSECAAGDGAKNLVPPQELRRKTRIDISLETCRN